MSQLFKRIGGWLAAVLTTAVLAVALQTQNVISRLDGIGADVGFTDRLSMTAYDIFYLGKPYALFIGIALAIAFLVGGLVFRIVKIGRPVIYVIAGAVALMVMLLAMKEAFFGVSLIAGARDGGEIGMQMLAGAVGGLVFARVSRGKAA